MTTADAMRRAVEIARLNDQLRSSLSGGMVLLTAGIRALPPEQQRGIIDAMRSFAEFTPDNDPHGEHDCSVMTVVGESIIWKIDYYDRDLEHGSPDPADPDVTGRVLTIMLASEY